MKICPQCKIKKNLSDFYQRKKYRWECERYHAYCKMCTRAKRKKWYDDGGREKVLVNAKKWRNRNPEKARERHRKWNWDSKIKAINYYGGKCRCCGIYEPKFLAIDHIGGNGNKHRKEIGSKTIYKWLRDNNYPKGFQILCHNCNMATAFWGKCPHKI